MSMQIKFKDDYNEHTYYFGTVNEKYDFVVEVLYLSSRRTWSLKSIEWFETPPKKKEKAENRIKDIILDWHKGRCNVGDVITGNDPGDEHVDVKKANEIIKKTPEYKRGKSIISSIGYRGEE